MTTGAWREEAISKAHDRKAFDCGNATLNNYLVRFARQNHDNGGAKTFVACDTVTPSKILGYYTVSPASIEYTRVPSVITRGLGRYDVAGFRLGRLAVDRASQGKGLGDELMFAAGARCLAASDLVGGVALIIDAKSDHVAQWYMRFGALRLDDAPLTLVLALGTLLGAVQARP